MFIGAVVAEFYSKSCLERQFGVAQPLMGTEMAAKHAATALLGLCIANGALLACI